MGNGGTTIWELTRGYRHGYSLSIAALVMSTLFAYLVPLVTRVTIDTIVLGDSRGFAPSDEGWWNRNNPVWFRGELWGAALLIAAMALVSGGFLHLKGRWAARASEGIIRRLRERLYDHLQHLPCSYYDQAETGDLVQRCTSDVETVRHFLAIQVVEIGRALLLLVTVIPIMLYLDVRMTLVSLAGTPIIVVFSVVFFLKIKPSFLQMDQAEGRMTSVLQENLTGIRVVRAFARQDFECQKFTQRSGEFRDHHYGLIRLLAVYWPVSDVMVLCQRGGVLLIGSYWVAQGELTLGTLVAFLAFVNIFIWPVRQMGRILSDLGKALVALGRLQEILNVPREDGSEPEPGSDGRSEDKLRSSRGHIVWEHVNFAYDRGVPVLNDVCFAAEPGQTLAIVGPSGSGKSTIVRLLLRFYDGYSGSIRIDGEDLRQLPRKWLRRQISVVMQEPFLYSKTVRQNIMLARPDASDDELVNATQIAGVHQDILRFDRQYETIVGERGVTLSGGQRQRVALSRALLQRPAILILDDALSAVDTQTESMILDALRARKGTHTTLIIAHRASTLRLADSVLVLDAGRVVNDERASQ